MDAKKRRERIEQRREERRRKQMMNLLYIIVGALIVVGALAVPSLIPQKVTPAPEREHPLAEGNALGDPEAPVVVEVFSDFQCSACEVYYSNVEGEIIAAYVSTGDVYYVYRSMGPFLGAESSSSAAAAYCAGDQGMYWEYHDIIYSNFSSGDTGGYSKKRLVAMADEIGLDTSEFKSCLNDDKYISLVNEDYVDGTQAGVTGTPSFFVNDVLTFRGVPTFKEFEAAILAARE
jgi:protein-disulfide isomerase